jgi:L-Ala-D/L-Glu epimerase
MSLAPLGLQVELEGLRLKAPFRISGYTFEDWPVAVATLHRGGRLGRGEASGVYYLDDTASKVVETLRRLAPELPSDLTREQLRELLPPGGARNALDCALWDLEARETGQPVWRLAEVAEPRPLLTTLTLSADPPDQMRRTALSLTEAKALKLKLTGDTDADIERVREVRAARPDVWMGVDANQGFTPATLEPLIPVLVEARVSLLEQPFKRGREADMEGLALPLPTAADESCQDLSEMEALRGRFDVVNIKLDKCGGLTEGLMMARRAKDLGLEVMVGNMLGTSLAVAPGLILGQFCQVVDLDNALFLVRDRDPPTRYTGGEVWVEPQAWGSGRG